MLKDNDEYNEKVETNTAFLNELEDKLPEFFSYDESKDRKTFNLEKLKNALRKNNIDELNDGYQLEFIGKDYARRQSGELPTTVIVPDNEYNKKNNSKNLFFTGDNIEVLKHLQNAYKNSIDFMFIDPPYNTGNNDFVYPDKFEYSDEKLKQIFGMNDSQISRLKSIQGSSSHSAWLTFMYPRIYLAKKLLSKCGVFLVSIDENEDYNLKEILIEIFGENNFITDFVWRKKTGANDSKDVATVTDSILMFAKNKDLAIKNKMFRKNEQARNSERYREKDDYYEQRGNFYFDTLDRGNLRYSDSLNYSIKAPDGTELYPNDRTFYKNDGWIWKWSKNKVKWGIDNGYIEIIKNNNRRSGWSVKYKVYDLVDNKGEKKEIGSAYSNLITNVLNTDGSKEIKELFSSNVFNNPKPVSLLKYFINIYNSKEITVMDFFAGSSTTAQAVMELNAEDNGNRKFIMVQIPEKTFKIGKDGNEVPTKGGKNAYDSGYKNIDYISRKRIVYAKNKLVNEYGITLPKNFDGNFKHYTIVEPNYKTLEDIDSFDPNAINLFNNVVEDFSSYNLGVDGGASGDSTILTTWLVEDGYKFNVSIKDISFDEYSGFLVDNSRMYLIHDGWTSNDTKTLLNLLGNYKLNIQTIVIFGYSFNISNLREIELGLKQLDVNINLLKRY